MIESFLKRIVVPYEWKEIIYFKLGNSHPDKVTSVSEIWCSHGGEDADHNFLGCDVVLSYGYKTTSHAEDDDDMFFNNIDNRLKDDTTSQTKQTLSTMESITFQYWFSLSLHTTIYNK
jgi:hypothetical protein